MTFSYIKLSDDTFSYLLFDLKSDSHVPKKLYYLLHWKPFENDEKRFFFYLKSTFSSQDI